MKIESQGIAGHSSQSTGRSGWSRVGVLCRRAGLSAALPLAAGVSLLFVTATASGQGLPAPVFSGKLDKINCSGAGSGTAAAPCSITVALVKRGNNVDNCNVPAASICSVTVADTGANTGSICGSGPPNRAPFGTGITGEILRALRASNCVAAINQTNGTINNPIALEGLQSTNQFQVADAGALGTFFDICIDGVRVGGTTPPAVAAANVCGYTFTQSIKLKIGNGSKAAAPAPAAPVPGLPLWGVLLLGAGLVSGGLLLRRNRSA